MEKKIFDLNGQTALVTGCSTGLGVQMARALAAQGASIAALARRKRMVDDVAAQIAQDFGVRAAGIVCDVTDSARVESAVAEVVEVFGGIHILINNAGVGAVAPAEEITDEQFFNELNVDLLGAFRVTRAAANQAMLPAGYGRIVNIASMYGLVGNRTAPAAPYHAAKGGLVNLTRALACEWGCRGITVNAICPGYFETPLTRETLESPAFQSYARGAIPLERYGRTGELDAAAIFLAAKESAYVNGAVLTVDGGYTAQ